MFHSNCASQQEYTCASAAFAQDNELQLKQLDVLRADVAEKDALVVSLTQAVQTCAGQYSHVPESVLTYLSIVDVNRE